MIRTFVLPVLMGTLMVGALPALADGNGSTEQQQERSSCTAAANSHYSAPASNECKKNAGGSYVAPSADGKYNATHYTNDVKCGHTNEQSPANPTGVHFYGAGDPTAPSGGFGLCSDGSVPLQGRVGASGNASSGLTVTVDGDKNNSTPASDKGTGYAVVKVGTGGPSVSCGKDYSAGGNGSSDHPVDAAMANC